MIQTSLNEYLLFAESQKDIILSKFLYYGWISTNNLKQDASQYGARIKELRLDGHLIISERINKIWGFGYYGRHKRSIGK